MYLPAPTLKATGFSRALLPASLAAFPGRARFSLPYTSAALRFSPSCGKARSIALSQEPLSFHRHPQNYTPRLLRSWPFRGSSTDSVLCRAPTSLPPPIAPPPRQVASPAGPSGFALLQTRRSTSEAESSSFPAPPPQRNFKIPVVWPMKKP